MKKYTALVPMKAHSERIPGKNFKEFLGKPLFQWVLESLLKIPSIESIVINTDRVDLFEEFSIIENEKIRLRDRDRNIHGDLVSMNKIIANDLEFLGEGHYIMTHSTNPLISSDTLSRSIKKYENCILEGYDSLFSVNKYQSRFYDSKMNPINHDPANLIRTQDLDPVFEENSCFYLFSYESFKRTEARIGENPLLFESPTLESVDIDDFNSWQQALINFEMIQKNEI